MRLATYCVIGFVLAACRTARGGRAGREGRAPADLTWTELPRLPDEHGLAGVFAGVSHDALIVAGGANFPFGRPWDEDKHKATKVWYDKVFVLADPQGPWLTGFKLPRPTAYGVSVTTADGVVCLGGSDGKRHFADVLRLRWTDGRDRDRPAAGDAPARGVLLRGGAGEQEGRGRPAHDLRGRRTPGARRAGGHGHLLGPGPFAVRRGPPLGRVAVARGRPRRACRRWPPRRAGPSSWSAASALDPNRPGDDKRVFLTDGYRYDPVPGEPAAPGRWTRIADLPRPAAAAPTPAIPLGQACFAVVGGDDGENAFRMKELKDAHPGFPAGVLTYNTITDAWAATGAFPKDPAAGLWPPVTTVTAPWRGPATGGRAWYVIPSGEARPGVRTPQVVAAEPAGHPRGFKPLDYAVLGVYLAALAAMGVYFSRREKSTEDFFLGGHRVPWWAAGLSIFGTQLSAITFMAVPAKAYHTDWGYFLGNMSIVAVAPLIVYLYLPFYRRLNVTSAYEYLERRFNLPTRLLGSAAFVLFQLGRMGIVLYLPAAALAAVTRMDVYTCIVLMGLLATFYTVLGGIEAVIWTDVLQVVVLLGGALLALVVIVARVDGGLAAVATDAYAAGKLRLADFSWDFTAAAVWVVMLGKPFECIVSYTSDQTVVQRYLTTADEKQAARSIWTNAALTVPASILFFAVGTALWAFYRAHPAALDPTGRIDEVFPWFIVQELPAGVSGLVIAGLFAAAMSSLDSSMNSMATTITTDFYRRFRPAASDRRSLGLARWLTLLLGAAGTGFALYMAWLGSTSMWDQYIKIVGLFGGGLAGLFAAGIFTRRTTGAGALVGFAGSALLLYYVANHTALHLLTYPAVGVIGCFAIGYAASLLMPARRRDLAGLTIYTLGQVSGEQVSGVG